MKPQAARISYQNIQHLIRHAVRRWSLPNQEKIVTKYDILEITKNWESIVGRSLAMHSLPEKLNKKTLWINTDHSIFAQQIQILADQILQEIQTKLGIKINRFRTKVAILQWNASSNVSTLPQAGREQALAPEIKSEDHKKKDEYIMSTSNRMTSKQRNFDRLILKMESLSHKKNV